MQTPSEHLNGLPCGHVIDILMCKSNTAACHVGMSVTFAVQIIYSLCEAMIHAHEAKCSICE